MTMSKKIWKILIVDDEPNNLYLMSQILKDTYKIAFASNGAKALQTVHKIAPDLILLDIMMPEMDGYAVCTQLKKDPLTAKIPVIFITAMAENNEETRGFDVGCVDYITKPISPTTVLARVATHLQLYNQKKVCELLVQQRTEELESSHQEAIHMLGEASHYNDTDTGKHIWRMAAYSEAIGLGLGLHPDTTKLLRLAATMHDTGKIALPDSILKKPQELNTAELAIMKTHPIIGHDILSKSSSPLFQLASTIAMYHHERWDGTGYPEGLKEKEIPLSARIVAVADVFDALTMNRPYKTAWEFEDAFAHILNLSGSHFDPEIVTCFSKIKDTILSIKATWEKKAHPPYPFERACGATVSSTGTKTKSSGETRVNYAHPTPLTEP